MSIVTDSLESRRKFAERCDRCNNCRFVPSATEERFAGSCPSIEYGQYNNYAGSGKNIMTLGIMDGRLPDITEEALRGIYACSACGACDTACKWNHADLVEPLNNMYALRKEMVERGLGLEAHKKQIESINQFGNRYGADESTRFDWAKGLNLKDISNEFAPVLLYIGCENAFDSEQHSELRAIVSLLQDADVDFGVLFEGEIDSGGYAFDVGFIEDAKSSAEKLTEVLKRSKAKKVISCSASSFSAFVNVYPRLGVDLNFVDVEHISQTISELVSQGKLTLEASPDETVSYHDSCKLGRLGEAYNGESGKRLYVRGQMDVHEIKRPLATGKDGIYDEPRDLLKSAGSTLAEMPRNREMSYCCGALGGGKEAYPDFACHAARERLAEAMSTGADTLVTACGSCTNHMRSVAQSDGLKIEVKSLFDYLSNANHAGAKT